jgi:hypothetical protein
MNKPYIFALKKLWRFLYYTENQMLSITATNVKLKFIPTEHITYNLPVIIIVIIIKEKYGIFPTAPGKRIFAA